MYSKFFACLSGCLLLISQFAFATPLTLLSEDFENGLPSAAVIASPYDGAWVNVRRHDDAIDGSGIVRDENFDDFFTEGHFLVLGDRFENLVGSNRGVSSLLLPFSLNVALNTAVVSIHYDWVFDTNAVIEFVNSDDFRVTLVTADGEVISTVHSVDQPVQVPDASTGTRGAYAVTLDAGVLAVPGDYGLKFTLTEHDGTYSSAVGLDNVSIVATVPEPGTALLMGLGLLLVGLVAWRRRE